jgi:hypothetical protein
MKAVGKLLDFGDEERGEIAGARAICVAFFSLYTAAVKPAKR